MSKNKRILFAEGNNFIFSRLMRLFSESFDPTIGISAATSRGKALEKLERGEVFDLVLVDIDECKFDIGGVDFVYIVRENRLIPRTTKLVLMTAFSSVELNTICTRLNLPGIFMMPLEHIPQRVVEILES